MDYCVVMNTKSIAIIITFTALCIALIPFRIPTIYWPGFYYYLWEIPIIAAFLLFGFKVALSISVLNTLARMVMGVNQNPLLLPLISFQPLLIMMLGIYLAQKLIQRQFLKGKPVSDARKGVYVTALGVAFRAMILPFMDYAYYHTLFPFFVGLDFPEAYIMGIMPGIVVFNILVPLYGVSIGYLVAKTVGKNLKIGPNL